MILKPQWLSTTKVRSQSQYVDYRRNSSVPGIHQFSPMKPDWEERHYLGHCIHHNKGKKKHGEELFCWKMTGTSSAHILLHCLSPLVKLHVSGSGVCKEGEEICVAKYKLQCTFWIVILFTISNTCFWMTWYFLII